MLRRLTWSSLSSEERRAIAERGTPGALPEELRSSIRELVLDVHQRGDRAVCAALERYDGVRLEPAELRITAEELDAATTAIDAELHGAIVAMIANITRFNEELLERRRSWTAEIAPGHTVGERVGPVASAAVFCPSGKASYPSVLAQVATPAVLAGVPELTVIVPPEPGGSGAVDAAVLVVARELGIDRVYRVNGPAGVAAAAFGTESIPRHGLVVGPGSPAVALAQLEVRGHGVDSVYLGPTESLVIADSSADVDLLAADLLNEAEHGPDSTVVLLTPDRRLIDATDRAIEDQASSLPGPRRSAASSALGVNGGAILVEDLDEAVAVANWFAAEHCQLAVADPWALADRIDHAGELLLGQATPFSVGNFLLGGPAALPTGGFARQSGGVTVERFLKSSAIGHLTPEALAAVGGHTIALADHEGFPAHGNAIRRRIQPDQPVRP